MSALQSQYWKYYKFFTEYKKDFLQKDIHAWEANNKYEFNFTPYDFDDIRSELKCLLLADIKKKYLKQVLHKLKTKCKKQRKKLDDEKDKGKRQILQKELNIICAQRKKGLKRLKQMKQD